MEDERPLRNSFSKKIDQMLRKTGYNGAFIEATYFHLEQIANYEAEKVANRDDICSYLMTKLFLDKIDLYPVKKFTSKVTENSDWPVPLLPLEFFAVLPEEVRTDCFYKFLQIGQILDCRVASIQPAEYSLRVIHKYNSTQILDDLNIMVILPRKKSEELLGEELHLCELIRVAVSNISKSDNRTTVTLEKSGEKLGRIGEECLPSYVLDPPDIEQYSSYSNYLINRPQFRNVTRLKEFFSDFGLDPKRMYSYHSAYDRLKCPSESTGQALLRKSRIDDSEKYAQKSLKESDVKQFPVALNLINMALELCPKDEPLKISLYQIRGDIYVQMKQLKNAVYDYVIAHYLRTKLSEKNYGKVKERLSNILFKVANKYYILKEYKTALTYVEISRDIWSRNKEAFSLWDYLKKKHPAETLVDLEQESLSELHKKKKKLQSKLKKYEPKVEASTSKNSKSVK